MHAWRNASIAVLGDVPVRPHGLLISVFACLCRPMPWFSSQAGRPDYPFNPQMQVKPRQG